MALQFDAYTAATRLRGELAPDEHVQQLLETRDAIALTPARRGQDWPAAHIAPAVLVSIDDLLVVEAPTDSPLFHAVRHPITVRVGPFEVAGDLLTLPGFDPGKSLARPGGTFVLLANVRFELAEHGGGQAAYDHACVNRYAATSVQAEFDLRLFFPGAEMVIASQGTEPP